MKKLLFIFLLISIFSMSVSVACKQSSYRSSFSCTQTALADHVAISGKITQNGSALEMRHVHPDNEIYSINHDTRKNTNYSWIDKDNWINYNVAGFAKIVCEENLDEVLPYLENRRDALFEQVIIKPNSPENEKLLLEEKKKMKEIDCTEVRYENTGEWLILERKINDYCVTYTNEYLCSKLRKSYIKLVILRFFNWF